MAATGVNHGTQAPGDAGAGLDHILLCDDLVPSLLDLLDQVLPRLGWLSRCSSLQDRPDTWIERVQIWTAGRPCRLAPEIVLAKVIDQPGNVIQMKFQSKKQKYCTLIEIINDFITYWGGGRARRGRSRSLCRSFTPGCLFIMLFLLVSFEPALCALSYESKKGIKFKFFIYTKIQKTM